MQELYGSNHVWMSFSDWCVFPATQLSSASFRIVLLQNCGNTISCCSNALCNILHMQHARTFICIYNNLLHIYQQLYCLPAFRSRSRSKKHGHRPAETKHDDRRRSRSKHRIKPKKKTEPDLGPQFAQFRSTKMPKYSKGYHALLSVIKDLRSLREKTGEHEEVKLKESKSPSRQSRRARSFSRGSYRTRC